MPKSLAAQPSLFLEPGNLRVYVRGCPRSVYTRKVGEQWRAYFVKPWGRTLGWFAIGATECEAVAHLQLRIDDLIEVIQNPLEGLE